LAFPAPPSPDGLRRGILAVTKMLGIFVLEFSLRKIPCFCLGLRAEALNPVPLGFPIGKTRRVFMPA
jgi:hypothetical protein